MSRTEKRGLTLFFSRRGQATTEVVLLLPIFMFFLFAFAKIFATLILVQKVEIASYYAARRWQLESHRDVDYAAFDGDAGGCGGLCSDIEQKALSYVGYGTASQDFLGLTYTCGGGKAVGLGIQRTQVWNVVTLTVCTKPIDVSWMFHTKGYTFQVTKYVPNRDRPIMFVLPGLKG
ncbi:MAG: pilus assembly protein [Elusimicrobia bacterium]|nr:pilus assembly protein [Elusimicrobiota bacterium]MDE2236897.1 pilus assembly protein [Elusimicrobiota bacterium]MDE2426223.1 pilus assembly protein [Elusimicrobiota bacterium]